MKMSEITAEALSALTPEEKWVIVCEGVADDGKTADFALLLGSHPTFAKERALAAAELYRAGRVRYVVPSGGVTWDTDGELLTEADYMTRILIDAGVPQSAIIPENAATTTKENMLFGAVEINRKAKFKGDKGIIIVTSQNHMKRSLALAKTFLPRIAVISGYPSYPTESKEEQLRSEEHVARLEHSLLLMKGLVDHGVIEDFELLLT